MLRFIPILNPRINPIKQVRSLVSHFSTSSHIFATDPVRTYIDLSTINCNSFPQSILSKCPNFFESEKHNFDKGTSIKELIFDISYIIPDVTRRFRRVSSLKPDDVLQLLLGFQSQCDRIAVDGKKVESLWGIFNWASVQDKGFQHLVQSCEVMASVLIRYGMLTEVQLLLLAMERQGISLDNNEIVSKLIESYVKASDVERAVLVYNQIREHSLIPLMSCYNVFIDLLVRMKRTPLAFQVCSDMVEIGIGFKNKDMAAIEKVVKLLCDNGLVQQARYLMKKVKALGFEISCIAVNEIASGYSEKKDFEDSVNLFVEHKCSPSALVGNRIIHDLCCSFGSGRANSFRLELESLGLKANEITFGILIGWCCSEGDLRSAFNLLAEMLSRGLKPVIWSYNALIGALFCEGMSKHVQHVLDEISEKGMDPNLSTFRTLLAGYCKARQFDELRITVHNMMSCGLIDSSSMENPLSDAFMVLGIDPLSVRLKRDNDVGFPSAEFFDNLGNGLYLDTDINEFEKRVNEILKGSMVPDFDSFVRMESDQGNIKNAFSLIDEMGQWGQQLSLSVFSTLLKRLCESRSNFRSFNHYIEKMPKLANQLGDDILNVLARSHCRNGMPFKAKLIFNQILTKNMKIENETYTALLVAFCKRGNLHDFHEFWEIARKNEWLPGLDHCESLVQCLCEHWVLKEVFELFESMLEFHPRSRSQICHMFIETLSLTGFTRIACKLADELQKQSCLLDYDIYSPLVRGFCNEKQYAEAFNVLDAMLASNTVPSLDVSLSLIPRLCSAERFDKALALREIGLREQHFDRNTINGVLIQGLCMAGKLREAENLVLKGLILDSETCDALFRGYCHAKSSRKVMELLGVTVRKFLSHEIATYRSFVRMMCSEGNYTLAFNLKELMLQNERHDSLVVYNILIFYVSSEGNALLVDRLLLEMEEKSLVLDEASYNFLVSKCKGVSRCAQYLSAMISKGFKPSYRSLQTAVTSLCEAGELSEALKFSRAMEMRGWFHGSVLQNTIVEALLCRDKVLEAESFLDRMEDKGLNPDSINYDNLIKRFCFLGRTSRAVSLVGSMLRKGNVPNSASYDSLIRGLCIRNEVDEAMDFHSEMLDRDLKPSLETWEMLVLKLCQVGRTAEAEKVLVSVVEFGETPKRVMFLWVIDRYRSENNSRKASEVMQMMQKSGYEPDFETQWSVISNLQNSKNCENNNGGEGFLSRLLSGSGFSYKKDSKLKTG